MCLVASLERTDRRSVDSNRSNTASAEMACSLRGDSHVILEEHSGPAAR